MKTANESKQQTQDNIINHQKECSKTIVGWLFKEIEKLIEESIKNGKFRCEFKYDLISQELSKKDIEYYFTDLKLQTEKEIIDLIAY